MKTKLFLLFFCWVGFLCAQNETSNEYIVCTDGRQVHVHVENAQIQWVNCETMEEIPGADSSSLLPLANGYYSVIVTVEGRSYQTSCVEVNGWPDEIAQGEAIELKSNLDNIEWILPQEADQVHLFDEEGAWVSSFYNTVTIDSKLKAGKYRAAIYRSPDQWMVRELLVSQE